MNRIFKIVLLFACPVAAFSLPLLLKIVHTNRVIDGGIGGVKRDAIGERLSLAGIVMLMDKYPSGNRFLRSYDTAEYDGRFTAQVIAGKREPVEWLYKIEYVRSTKVLTKMFFDHNPATNPRPDRIWVWENVTEDALRKISAPIRAMKSYNHIDVYKGGNISDLKPYGAVLAEEKGLK